MIDGSEKRNGWLNFELQSPHVIERHSKALLSETFWTWLLPNSVIFL